MKLEVFSRCRVTEPVVRSCTSVVAGKPVGSRGHGASYRDRSAGVAHTHVLFLDTNLQYSRQVMGSLTGIELDGGSCVLVRVRPADDAVRLLALGGTMSSVWESAQPLVDNLRRARRSGFPKHAAVVAWDVHESASATDP